MRWPEVQERFAEALRHPELAAPEAVAGTRGRPSSKRFDVYRNNCVVSLTEALAAGFPVVERLVGEDFFKAMARVYVDRNLPRSPILLDYGESFPDFVEGFEPARSVPCLGDVARVEWARTRCYHAPDRAPIGIERLSALAESEMAAAGLTLHPSLQLLDLAWPAVSIWLAHQQDGTEERLRDLPEGGECAMIVRPELDVVTRAIAPRIHGLFRALQAGRSLGEAAAPLEGDETVDLAEGLRLLFQSGAVVALT